jgi:hypothetical protein
MFTHPQLMLDLAKQRQADLIEDARRFRRRHRVPPEHRARPAPATRPAQASRPAPASRPETNVGPVGTLSVCEMPRELTAGRAQ